jgi:hypothetical protein
VDGQAVAVGRARERWSARFGVLRQSGLGEDGERREVGWAVKAWLVRAAWRGACEWKVGSCGVVGSQGRLASQGMACSRGLVGSAKLVRTVGSPPMGGEP